MPYFSISDLGERVLPYSRCDYSVIIYRSRSVVLPLLHLIGWLAAPSHKKCSSTLRFPFIFEIRQIRIGFCIGRTTVAATVDRQAEDRAVVRWSARGLVRLRWFLSLCSVLGKRAHLFVAFDGWKFYTFKTSRNGRYFAPR